SIAMKRRSNIPILRARDDEVLPGNPPSKVILSSAATNWRGLIVEEHRIPYLELNGSKFVHNVVGVYLGKPVHAEVKPRGRFRHSHKQTVSISRLPSHQPYFARMNPGKNAFEQALYLVAEPTLVNEVAHDLAIHSDSVELVAQHGITDPVLLHIAMAL